MPPKPKSRCCFSTPQCRRCPLRLTAEAQAEPPPECGDRLPALFHEVLRAEPRPLPESVSQVLRSLSEARATAPAEAG
ncbi:MAG TPA: hypothetical protein VGF25_02630 [Thermoleophilaceae bacterium]